MLPLALRPRALRCPCESNEDEAAAEEREEEAPWRGCPDDIDVRSTVLKARQVGHMKDHHL